MTINKMDEIILVTERATLFDDGFLEFQGTLKTKEHVGKIINNLNDNLSIMRRGDAEDNPNYKQPIPYAVIKRGNQYFGYTRLQGGGESRLHGSISLGVGGHMNNIEGLNSFDELLMENLERELNEELNINSESMDINVVGLINDDENEVGKVHIGLLITIDLPLDAKVDVNETEQLEGKWFTLEELVQQYSNLESWSKFVVDTLN